MTLEQVFQEIHEWQLKTFPHSTAYSKAKHLEKEVAELLQDPSSRGEIADCLMLCIGIAMMQGIDVIQCLSDKFEINKRRKWGKPNADGVVEHVRETKGGLGNE